MPTMSNHTNASLYSSANNSTATLRPRMTRLVSFANEGEHEPDRSGRGKAISSSTSTATSTSTLNASTKRTSAGPNSRNLTGADRTTKGGENARTGLEDSQHTRRGSGTSGLWDSWSQIQGIASTFLGSDASATADTGSPGPGQSLRGSAWMKQDRSRAASKGAQKWGPRAPANVEITSGAGAIEQRQASLQAKKRAALLLSITDEAKDSSGKVKRKDSDGSLTVRSPIIGDDALVYKHRVLPNDTVAGVAIKYSCQPEAFRKMNRLWPNDKIQIRDYVYLPVEACALRGRKVDGPDNLDLLGEIPFEDGTETKLRGHSVSSQSTASNTHTSDSSAVGEPEDDYQHDSWVVLPNVPGATEILRIPRTKLGYFPAARRKAVPLLATGIESATSSPRTSFDTLRHPPSHAALQAQLQQQTLKGGDRNASPHQRYRMATSSTLPRHRTYSNATTSSQQANATSSSFFLALHGPGGVGSLRGLRTESSRPGPADDSLNQKFAQYLPSLALTTAQSNNMDEHSNGYPSGHADYLMPHGAARALSQTILGRPRASMESLRSSRSGRSNSSTSAFGTGVENWVKKLASATGSRPSTSRRNSDRTIGPASTAVGIGIGGESGLGDLIEMETNSEMSRYHDISDNDDHGGGNGYNSGIDQSPPQNRSGSSRADKGALGRAEVRMAQAQEEEEQRDLLNQRFPIRGRVTTAYTEQKR